MGINLAKFIGLAGRRDLNFEIPFCLHGPPVKAVFATDRRCPPNGISKSLRGIFELGQVEKFSPGKNSKLALTLRLAATRGIPILPQLCNITAGAGGGRAEGTSADKLKRGRRRGTF